MNTRTRPTGRVGLDRRRFLARVTGAAAAVGFPALLPSSALGLAGTVAPSNRVRLGVIGAGGKGVGGMMNFLALSDVEVAAVCDPNANARRGAMERAGLQPADTYADFRELLARPDVDAVLIATPDHWHVPIAVAAAAAGKDVYCEKPLSNTVAEGRALVEAVTRHGIVFQHGTQLRSMEGTRRACELVRNGYLGELTSIRIGSPPGQAMGNVPEEPVPEWLDYDRWLGPAPWRPFSRHRVVAPNWYFISDYSKAGWVAGYAVHDIDIAQWALGVEETGPVEIAGQGVYPEDGLFDTVLTFEVHIRYANGVTITLTDTGRNRHGVLFEGRRGRVFTRGGIEADPPSLARITPRPDEVRLCESRSHERNFIDCVRTRARTLTPAEVAHRSTSTCLLAGIALKLGRALRWDPVRECVLDDDEANRLLACAHRPPWHL